MSLFDLALAPLRFDPGRARTVGACLDRIERRLGDDLVACPCGRVRNARSLYARDAPFVLAFEPREASAAIPSGSCQIFELRAHRHIAVDGLELFQPEAELLDQLSEPTSLS